MVRYHTRPARLPLLWHEALRLLRGCCALLCLLTCVSIALGQNSPPPNDQAPPPASQRIPRTDIAPSNQSLENVAPLDISTLPAGRTPYRPYHYFQRADMPPGSIGQAQLMRGGPLPGYYQPVEISAPADAQLALAIDGTFESTRPAPLSAGLLIGHVYRLKVTNIPFQQGQEVFPSVEIINRLYPPQGSETRFPIPIELTREELELALGGQFVIRVIYLEDPHSALPRREDPEQQRYFEVGAGQDPLEVADGLGRPMAILRIGSRVPELDPTTGRFLFDSPPWMRYSEVIQEQSTPVPAPLLSEPTATQGAERYLPRTTAQTRQAGVGVNR